MEVKRVVMCFCFVFWLDGRAMDPSFFFREKINRARPRLHISTLVSSEEEGGLGELIGFPPLGEERKGYRIGLCLSSDLVRACGRLKKGS